MSEPTTWPEGVIARYLTAGGATVDLTAEREFSATGKVGLAVIAFCSACAAVWHQTGLVRAEFAHDIDETIIGDKARKWANQHATECRAMPKPSEEH